ncbi:hypothetical protein A8622_003401 [Escherichia coli]|nr:hypothetical protein [Escherichia coli]EFK2025062.1 hypothetical protein [Escherichia coli]EFK3609295.1 hypothetical protein [Escherichia coli]HAW7935385.1 hypothetical protein [Escherichia coli]
MRFFCVRNKPSYVPIMVGRSGGAFALAGFFVAGLLTLLRLTTPFSSGLVRFAKSHKEAAVMVTIPTQTHPLLSVPFNAATDFTILADYCTRFAETLIETDDPALRLALCGRLHAGLALLQPSLNDTIPPHLVESLTVDTPPATTAHFEPEPDLLCEYCLVLLQLLLERPAEPKTEQLLTGLLCELVWYFTEGLKAPRWLRTADGVKFIDGVVA